MGSETMDSVGWHKAYNEQRIRANEAEMLLAAIKVENTQLTNALQGLYGLFDTLSEHIDLAAPDSVIKAMNAPMLAARAGLAKATNPAKVE